MKLLNVAVVGAGAVGKTLLEVIEERNFPVGTLKILATERSAGKSLPFRGKDCIIEKTTPEAFDKVDLALFAGGGASKEFARAAVEARAIVIDNSSTFRLDPAVPLVVPEVNPEDVDEHQGIIANPNCSTIQMVVALKPLHDAGVIKRVVVSTYQAVSGAGQEAMDELWEQTGNVLNDMTFTPRAFAHQIAFNAIPQIDVFQDNDYTKEEMKMVDETRKMFHAPKLSITATCVRIPVLRSHSEAVNIELERKITASEAREILSKAPGVIVVDKPKELQYPMPIHCSNKDEVFVGRIREDISIENGLCLWIIADQLRKGAATNAVQIAELMLQKGMLG